MKARDFEVVEEKIYTKDTYTFRLEICKYLYDLEDYFTRIYCYNDEEYKSVGINISCDSYSDAKFYNIDIVAITFNSLKNIIDGIVPILIKDKMMQLKNGDE